jgi:hypothetical protein
LRAADKPAVTWGSHATATSVALSRDDRLINHVSETGTGSRQRAMSKDEKEELCRAFLAWQRKQVIDNKRDQSTLR